MNLCPECGANLDLVGMRHRCVSKDSGGGGESRPALKPSAEGLARRRRPNEVPLSPKQVAAAGGAAGEVLKAPIAGVASGPPEANLRKGYNEYMREYMRKWRERKREGLSRASS